MTRAMLPEVVIFDLDDTLVVEDRVARASLRDTVRLVPGFHDGRPHDEALRTPIRQVWRDGPHYQLCLQLGIASSEGLWATFEGSHSSMKGLRDWIPTYRHAAWRAVLASFGAEDENLIATMTEAYIVSQRRRRPLINGASQLIGSLARIRTLGLLTNGPADIQRYKLENSGLADHFDDVVISGEVGIGKPDPRAFTLTLEHLGVNAHQAVMVGDSWERDILGALDAGMSAIWVAQGRRACGPHPNVTVIENLSDLLDTSA